MPCASVLPVSLITWWCAGVVGPSYLLAPCCCASPAAADPAQRPHPTLPGAGLQDGPRADLLRCRHRQGDRCPEGGLSPWRRTPAPGAWPGRPCSGQRQWRASGSPQRRSPGSVIERVHVSHRTYCKIPSLCHMPDRPTSAFRSFFACLPACVSQLGAPAAPGVTGLEWPYQLQHLKTQQLSYTVPNCNATKLDKDSSLAKEWEGAGKEGGLGITTWQQGGGEACGRPAAALARAAPHASACRAAITLSVCSGMPTEMRMKLFSSLVL